MARVAAKTWTKRQVKDTLTAINEELGKVLGGADPVEAIKAIDQHIRKLKRLNVQPIPAKESDGTEPKPRIPYDLRRKLETVIKRNELFLEALASWNTNGTGPPVAPKNKRLKK